jgi:hypothetical protein
MYGKALVSALIFFGAAVASAAPADIRLVKLATERSKAERYQRTATEQVTISWKGSKASADAFAAALKQRAGKLQDVEVSSNPVMGTYTFSARGLSGPDNAEVRELMQFAARNHTEVSSEGVNLRAFKRRGIDKVELQFDGRHPAVQQVVAEVIDKAWVPEQPFLVTGTTQTTVHHNWFTWRVTVKNSGRANLARQTADVIAPDLQPSQKLAQSVRMGATAGDQIAFVGEGSEGAEMGRRMMAVAAQAGAVRRGQLIDQGDGVHTVKVSVGAGEELSSAVKWLARRGAEILGGKKATSYTDYDDALAAQMAAGLRRYLE